MSERRTYRQWADPSAEAVMRWLARGTPGAPVAEDRQWWHRAACRGYDTDLFFPGSSEPSAVARKVCAACPVRESCLADAMAYPVSADHGIWGGTTEHERMDERAARNRVAA